jgi:hypothetical protein
MLEMLTSLLNLSRRILPAMVCIGVFVACNKSATHPLEADPTIQEIFSPEEVQDLATIMNFFEKQICEMLNVRSDSVIVCYNRFLQNVASAQRTGVIYVPIQFEAQKEMYKQLSPAAFREIWLRGTGINQETGDTTVRMNLSYNGKYMQFLEALKDPYPLLGAYHKSFVEEQGMNSVMIESFLFNFHLYNLSDVRIRVLMGLHYLTINDIYERKSAVFQSPETRSAPQN